MAFHMRMRRMHVDGGKLVVDCNIRRNVTAKGDHVYGRCGRKKINRWVRKTKKRKAKRRV